MKTLGVIVGMFLALSMATVAEDDFDQFNEPPKTPTERPSENVALNAAYTVEPRPNYSYCTEPGDATQLTDGQYVEGYFWVQKGCVGWRNAKPVIITIDLGEVQPIRGVSFDTAGGRAGVAWPLAIYVFVAGEDKQFHEVAELVTLSAENGLPPADEYATHRYWTDKLRTHGRYVCFVVSTQPYAFCDEIEVFAGDPEWLQEPLPGEPVKDVRAHMRSFAIMESVRRRVREDMAALGKKAASERFDESVQAAAKAELDYVEQHMVDMPVQDEAAFRAVLPLNPRHERLFQVQAALWRAEGYPPLVAWQSSPWGMLLHLADPPHDAAPAVEVRMMQNEYRAGAFNLSNTTDQAVDVVLRIEGLPGGANPGYITVHEVAWTDTTSGKPVADALPEAARTDEGYRISIPSGMTRQVWLTFHPTDVAPGEYQGAVSLQTGDTALEVPVLLKVYPFRFPDEPALHFGGWDYTNTETQYGLTPQNRAPLIAHLREHFVDSPWGTAAILPHGVYDADGHMTEPPSTAAFDAWLDLWPNAQRYCVFASVRGRAGQFDMGTPGFTNAVKEWATFWGGYAKKQGLRPEQLAVLLVDEPHSSEQDATIMAWAEAIRAAESGIRIWEDPTYRDIREANVDMIALCDVLCPNRPIFVHGNAASRDFYVGQRKAGKALEFYSCSGPVRLLDPYGYHRLQAWLCWQYDATASYFWAFADTGGADSSWNEYLTQRNSYTPLFLEPDGVTAGKHMEACREGMEDYEYLVMLRDAIERAPANAIAADVIARARTLLDEAPARVCEAGTTDDFMWAQDIDRGVADATRIEILDMLVALTP